MALNNLVSFYHIATKSIFNSKKKAINSTNTGYIQNGTTSTTGTPEIPYNCVCFIDETNEIWHGGKFYGGSTSLSDCILDLGLVANAAAAYEQAGLPDIVNNSKIRMILWRTSDANMADGGRGAGGTIFQERVGNWFITQWIMFDGTSRISRARTITTGGHHVVGPWQDIIMPVSMSYDPSTYTIIGTGTTPQKDAGPAYTKNLVTLPVASNTRTGFMTAAAYNKLYSLHDNDYIDGSLNVLYNLIEDVSTNKVSKEPGKGLSTYDFNLEQLLRVNNAGVYGRKSGLKYGVRNLHTLSASSDNETIQACLTSKDGVRLLETDLTYCAENGCCLLNETTNGHVIVNKATDGTCYNLIEISSPKVGSPEAGASFMLPIIRVVTLLSRVPEGTAYEDIKPENNIWRCYRVIYDKIGLKSLIDLKCNAYPNAIYSGTLGSTQSGITLFYNVDDDGNTEPLTTVSPAGIVRFAGNATLGKTVNIGANVNIPNSFNITNQSHTLTILTPESGVTTLPGHEPNMIEKELTLSTFYTQTPINVDFNQSYVHLKKFNMVETDSPIYKIFSMPPVLSNIEISMKLINNDTPKDIIKLNYERFQDISTYIASVYVASDDTNINDLIFTKSGIFARMNSTSSYRIYCNYPLYVVQNSQGAELDGEDFNTSVNFALALNTTYFPNTNFNKNIIHVISGQYNIK